jgi:hypothetical protein
MIDPLSSVELRAAAAAPVESELTARFAPEADRGATERQSGSRGAIVRATVARPHRDSRRRA